MTFEEKLRDLITNHLFDLESQLSEQRQAIYIELEGAKATISCLSHVNNAIRENYKEQYNVL
ncbi:hypothetical protein VPH5P1C_0223 [Vibrio phage 5P1c]|nr:hypothetical protein VP495E541_P0222 [Vibrio phage 495E54-1]CAH9014625.1 hypothetical protein VP496E541_P0222 [Vibrio phage 496E54-1]